MFSLQHIISLFFVFGAVHLQLTLGGPINAEQTEIQSIINDGVSDIEILAKKYEQISSKIAKELLDKSETLKNETNNFLFKIREELDYGSGLLEDKVAELSSFKLSDKTCGIMNFRDTALKSFDITRDCTMSYLEESVNSIHDILVDTGKGSEELVNIIQGIRKCAESNETDIETIRKCVSDNKSVAFEVTKQITYVAMDVKNVAKVASFSFGLKKCLALEAFKSVQSKASAISDCLKEKVPAFAKAAAEVDRVKDLVKEDVKNKINNVRNEIISMPDKIKSKLSDSLDTIKEELKKEWQNVMEEVGNMANKIKFGFLETLGNIANATKEIASNTATDVLETVENIADKTISQVSETAADVENKVIDTAEKTASGVLDTAGDIASATKEIASNATSDVLQTAGDGLHKLGNFFSNTFG